MKRYLGDGVYVDFDGFQIVLTTEDGLRATNTIYLEPEVVNALFRFAQQVDRGIRDAFPKDEEKGEPVMWDSSKPGNEGY